MSKQSEAKKAQGYTETPRSCATCAHYSSELKNMPAAFSWSDPYTREINKRCGIGGFAVKKTAHCNHWVPVDGR